MVFTATNSFDVISAFRNVEPAKREIHEPIKTESLSTSTIRIVETEDVIANPSIKKLPEAPDALVKTIATYAAVFAQKPWLEKPVMQSSEPGKTIDLEYFWLGGDAITDLYSKIHVDPQLDANMGETFYVPMDALTNYLDKLSTRLSTSSDEGKVMYSVFYHDLAVGLREGLGARPGSEVMMPLYARYPISSIAENFSPERIKNPNVILLGEFGETVDEAKFIRMNTTNIANQPKGDCWSIARVEWYENFGDVFAEMYHYFRGPNIKREIDLIVEGVESENPGKGALYLGEIATIQPHKALEAGALAVTPQVKELFHLRSGADSNPEAKIEDFPPQYLVYFTKAGSVTENADYMADVFTHVLQAGMTSSYGYELEKMISWKLETGDVLSGEQQAALMRLPRAVKAESNVFHAYVLRRKRISFIERQATEIRLIQGALEKAFRRTAKSWEQRFTSRG